MKRLIILVVVLFTAIGTFVVNLGPREMTLKDLHPTYIPRNIRADSALPGTAETDSTKRPESSSQSANASTPIHISLLPNLSKRRANSASKPVADTTSADKRKPDPKTESQAKAVSEAEVQSKPKPKTVSVPVPDSEAACYIIVESLKDEKTAVQRAEKLKKQFNMDFLVLPPTKEGNYRVSCGYPGSR
jgi:cytoskeletal protein RodZ